MYPSRFRYVAPSSLDEAITLTNRNDSVPSVPATAVPCCE